MFIPLDLQQPNLAW